MTEAKPKPARRAKAVVEAPREKRAARRTKAPAPGGDAANSGAEHSAAPPKGPAGKLGTIVALMRRPQGTTLAQMSEATGWQAHSVRGAIAGSLKKTHGLTITSEPAEGGRVYCIAGDAPIAGAAAEPAA